MRIPYYGRHFCGCWYLVPAPHQPEKKYLAQVDLTSSTQILATTSRTVLTQTFVNRSKTDNLDEVQYTFPLYDGVSVVGFQCTVASRTIVGVVKEKQEARADYKAAVDCGETAGLLEQLPEASDVFTTKIGNVPANEKIVVEIVYLGELKHDSETDGSRFTIPTFIAPRYGEMAADSSNAFSNQASDKGGIRILVDVIQEAGSAIRGLQSPSHPIAVTMGRTSFMDEDAFDNNHASATLTLGSTELDKDFIIVVLAQNQDTPRALLETHSSIPDQRALMTTLVPKFSLPNIHPEIVFVVDRSGSMGGKIPTLVSAMKIFLKSLPVGIKFNICSFGSSFDFLFKNSQTYDQISMTEALRHLEQFSANYGGTEMLKPVVQTVKNRYKDMPLEVMLITDGEIWNQQELFDFVNKTAKEEDVRYFSLGIGAGASSSLVEGIARAGGGFAQFVGDNEKMDKRVVRMLKGALTPHIKDYSLEVKYEKDDVMDDDFEIVESANDSLKVVVTGLKKPSPRQKVISLFDKSTTEEPTNPSAGRYDHLPTVSTPKILQTPHRIPALYPFNRTTVYLLISEEACRRTPSAVVLRATSAHGPLELEIPVQDVGHGQTIHQLAAKKAVHELEQGRGWITEAKCDNGKLVSAQFEGRWDQMVEREAVRLGVQFQVGGKWCSFVAVEKNTKSESQEKEDVTWEIQEGSEDGSTNAQGQLQPGGGAMQQKAKRRGPAFGGESPFANVTMNSGALFSANLPKAMEGSCGMNQYQTGSPIFGFPASSVPTGGFGGNTSSQSNKTGALFGHAQTASSRTPGGGLYGCSKRSSSGGSSLFEPSPSLFSAGHTPNSNGFGSQTTAGGLFGKLNTTGLDNNSVQPAGFSSFAQTSNLGDQAPASGLFGNSAASPSLSSHVNADHSFTSGGALFAAQSRAAPLAMSMAAPLPPVQKGEYVSWRRPASSAPSYAMARFRASSRTPRVNSVQTSQVSLARSEEKKSNPTMDRSASPQRRRKESGLFEKHSDAEGEGMVYYQMESEQMAASPAYLSLPKSTGAGSRYTSMGAEEKMHALISLQNFDGSWNKTDALLQILGVDWPKLAGAFTQSFQTQLAAKTRDSVITTLAAIVFLEVKVKGEKDVWDLVVEKANEWVRRQIQEGYEAEMGALKGLIGT